ncbi:MAG TPA: proteasome subunit beta [Nitrososphaerales archaeon]|nr:proteasome subunit beta [Nitrososphaerales archaeon]
MTTIVGISCMDGVVLSSDRRASKGFFIGSKITQKILQIDDTIGVAIAGQVSDAEYLVNAVRAERKLVTLQRGYPLTVKETAKLIANIAYNGMKNYQPYLAEFIVAGVDLTGPHVLISDMSGAVSAENFVSTGSGSPIAYGVLESTYKEGLSLEEGKEVASSAVRAAMERDPGSGNGIDVVTIPTSALQLSVAARTN